MFLDKVYFYFLSYKKSEQTEHETPSKCQLDTGATCSVLSYRDLSIITQDGNPPMEQRKTKLQLFDESKRNPWA